LDGVHYHFIDRDSFERMQSVGDFLEWREYAGNLYGTPKAFIAESLAAGRDLVMKPEVSGAMAIKRAYPHAVLVFLIAPSADALRQRLEQRRTESRSTIDERIDSAPIRGEA